MQQNESELQNMWDLETLGIKGELYSKNKFYSYEASYFN